MENKLILWFSEVGQEDIEIVGGKGANLGEMVKSLKVPPGFCLTSMAYKGNLQQNKVHDKILQVVNKINIEDFSTIDEASAEIYKLITNESLSIEIQEAVTKAYNELSKGKVDYKVAVRSSATAEDLEEASFAGQQETYLNVSGIDDVMESIKKCWASLWTSRAIHYRTKKGFDHSQVYMAVVIQEMLPAEISGVMFTANPVSNSRKELLIEATRGLGEALVSGTVTGDNYIIAKDGIQILSKNIADEKQGQLLPDEVIRDLALHGVKIENYYENYQDIEWAYFKGELYFLQSRAITTLADEEIVNFDPDKSTEMQKEIIEHIAERYPEPIYPIDSIVVKLTYEAYFQAMEKYGYFVPKVDWTRIEKGDFPDYFEPPLIRPGRHLRALYPIKLLKAIKSDPAKEWHKERVYLLDVLRKVADREINKLPYDLVFSYVNEALSQFQYFIILRYNYFVNNRLPTDVLISLLKRLFGNDAEKIREDLLAGIPCITTDINRELRALAHKTKNMPNIHDYIKEGEFSNFRDKLMTIENGSIFLQAFDNFLGKYGDRETSMGLGGIASVNWHDAPEVVMGIIRGMMLENPKLEQLREQKIKDRVQRAENLLNQKLSSSVYKFIPKSFVANLIKQSKSFDAFRENSHYDVTMSLKVFKKLFLELGQRFARTDTITDPKDIYYLSYYEIKDIIFTLFHQITKLNIKAIKAKIEQRKIDLVKRTNRWRSRNQLTEANSENSIIGIPASSGAATGTARIINDASEFYKLQPGDIMVAPYTNPAWTPLFTTAAGLVVDTGGAASHAAIIAREYGIPAVMGTGNATYWIKDGEKITIDGSNGLVLRDSIPNN